GNRVQHPRDPCDGRIQSRDPADGHAEREGQDKADSDRDTRQLHMFQHAAPDIRDVAEGPVPQDQRLALSPRTRSAARAARSAVMVSASERNAAPSVSSVSTAAYRPRSSTTTAV